MELIGTPHTSERSMLAKLPTIITNNPFERDRYSLDSIDLSVPDLGLDYPSS